MGFSELGLKWFTSHLTGRTQVCDVEDTISNPQRIACEVPQGSILGPLLFIVYINDIWAYTQFKLHLYIDDSVLPVPGSNAKDIEITPGKDLESQPVACQ